MDDFINHFKTEFNSIYNENEQQIISSEIIIFLKKFALNKIKNKIKHFVNSKVDNVYNIDYVENVEITIPNNEENNIYAIIELKFKKVNPVTIIFKSLFHFIQNEWQQSVNYTYELDEHYNRDYRDFADILCPELESNCIEWVEEYFLFMPVL